MSLIRPVSNISQVVLNFEYMEKKGGGYYDVPPDQIDALSAEMDLLAREAGYEINEISFNQEGAVRVTIDTGAQLQDKLPHDMAVLQLALGDMIEYHAATAARRRVTDIERAQFRLYVGHLDDVANQLPLAAAVVMRQALPELRRVCEEGVLEPAAAKQSLAKVELARTMLAPEHHRMAVSVISEAEHALQRILRSPPIHNLDELLDRPEPRDAAPEEAGEELSMG